MDAPTHAGAVVARQANGRLELLLIRANSPGREWVLPKGHIEAGESAEAAAIREVREETGVDGRIVGPLATLDLRRGVRAAFYLLVAERQGRSAEQREATWLTFEDAVTAAAYEETRTLLRQARERLRES